MNAITPDNRTSDINPIKYAGLTRRILANIIDIILSLLLALIILLISIFPVILYTKIIEPAFGPLFDHDTILAFFLIIGALVGFTALISYFVVLQASHHRATYGMRLLSIQIVDESFEAINKKVAFARLFFRAILRSIPYLYSIISFFMILCSKKKRAPHDIMTETYIIRKPLTSDKLAQITATATANRENMVSRPMTRDRSQ
jgi:uncharacterized RDD family membrane protein YckC